MIHFNYDMEAAPRDRRILALRADGDISCVRWDWQRYHKSPAPYWSDDRGYMGVKWCRANPPIAWAELRPAAPN